MHTIRHSACKKTSISSCVAVINKDVGSVVFHSRAIKLSNL